MYSGETDSGRKRSQSPSAIGKECYYSCHDYYDINVTILVDKRTKIDKTSCDSGKTPDGML